jgi:LAGLIDADG endonuclease
VGFRFIIEVHKEDVKVLYKICEKLGIGTENINNNSALFIVNKIEEIVNILISIFQEFPLQTSKYLDFSFFLEAVLIKKSKNKRYFITTRNNIKKKESMNS